MALGPERAEPLLRTLQAYLDHNNSPARAAEVLHLHRNAVGARIRRFTEPTGADLNDPAQRIALQLACRAGLAPPPPP
ncbi:helix-turn-helix domain-containing protein [Streptomyces sp. TE33382]